MAADNKLLLFNTGKLNILDDTALAATDWDDKGIVVNEIAYSNRLNALLRQITTVTYSFADLIANQSAIVVDSDANALTRTIIKTALTSIVLEKAEDKTISKAANLVWAAPSGAAGAPSFRVLAAADIPALPTSKITTGTFGAAFLAADSVETAKIKDLNVTVGKLAANAVETAKIKDANVTFSKIQNGLALSVLGVSGNTTGVMASIVAGTDGYVLRRNGTVLDFSQITSTGIADSAVINAKIGSAAVSKSKLSQADVLIAGGAYFKDELISPKHSSVIGYLGMTGTTLAQYYIRFVTQAEYDGGTKEANTFYVITT